MLSCFIVKFVLIQVLIQVVKKNKVLCYIIIILVDYSINYLISLFNYVLKTEFDNKLDSFKSENNINEKCFIYIQK